MFVYSFVYVAERKSSLTMTYILYIGLLSVRYDTTLWWRVSYKIRSCTYINHFVRNDEVLKGVAKLDSKK